MRYICRLAKHPIPSKLLMLTVREAYIVDVTSSGKVQGHGKYRMFGEMSRVCLER